MKTVRINFKNSPVSGSIHASRPVFLNYAELVADTKSHIEMEKDYQAERVIHLTNSTGNQNIFMVIQTTVTVSFTSFQPQYGGSFIVPKLKEVVSRKVVFYCLDKGKKLEEVNATFGYSGKTLNYNELTQVGNFKPQFIYDDSELEIAVHRSHISFKDDRNDYKPQITPFAERVFS